MSTVVRPGEARAAGVVLRRLARLLARAGYGDYCASFSPTAPRFSDWIEHRRDLDSADELALLVDLFLLARPVAASQLDPALRRLTASLIDMALLVELEGGRLATPGLVLLPVFGNWLFFQQPQLNPSLYFGDDSLALLLRLLPAPGGRCLDLCAGPGVQSLHCSRFAAQVTAIEVNPAAAALARLNVLMNGRERRVRVLCGDLYGPVRDQRFDTIVANPPLLPFPDELPYPFVGHGGPDGLRITRRILDGLPAALAPGGTAHLIGTGLSDCVLPFFVEELDTWSRQAGLSANLTVLAHRPLCPGSEYFEGLVATAAGAANLDRSFVADRFHAALRAIGADHLCAYTLQITHGAGRLRIRDLSRDSGCGLWYV